jgi:hypothetical protein
MRWKQAVSVVQAWLCTASNNNVSKSWGGGIEAVITAVCNKLLCNEAAKTNVQLFAVQ